VIRLHNRFRTAALIAAVVLASTGCTATVNGSPQRAPDTGPGGAIVAVMDTGPYATAPGRPLGAAGADQTSQGLLEAQRMAEYVVGPWEIEADVHGFPGALDTTMTGPVAGVVQLGRQYVLPAPLPDIAGRHGYITGFSTFRVTEEGSLQNLVMRFPDPAAAEAAAAEMAAADPGPPSLDPLPPPYPTPFPDVPRARIMTWDLPDNTTRVRSFTAHGAYVLFQWASSTREPLAIRADHLANFALTQQMRRIDAFTPTPRDKLAELPLDPTGKLMAQTLAAPTGGDMPFLIGAWNPRGWLHFEPDPAAAERAFTDAGVTVVTQRLATVYEASDPDKAVAVADDLATETGRSPKVRAIDGVTGLPAAKCFARVEGGVDPKMPSAWHRVYWGFKCVAHVDRYAYTAYSATERDVKQQMAAQYRILAGE
jgi:hypothetical protein